MRIGIAHHLGWAVAVTATADHEVVDRRRIELVGPGLPNAPVHHEGGPHAMHRTGPVLTDDDLAALVARVRASSRQVAAGELDALVADLGAPVTSISLRAWPADFPTDVAVQRVAPHESQADSVMYRAVLAELATERGWRVCTFDAATVEREAAGVLGADADEVLRAPRAVLGPPWAKDHRLAFAATIVAGADAG